MRNSGRIFIAVFLGILVAPGIAVAQAPSPLTSQQPPSALSRPNIVFMLADNIGYGVLSYYNGGILDTPTQRIDKDVLRPS
jgi:hypothetical protein